jgi:phosphopantothenoylcysteine decarboxylase/phosphopantothenate--cysteine ligase
VALADPAGVATRHVESAREMLAACEAALPVDVAVCAAAVADWRPAAMPGQKLKKDGGAPVLELVENPDILRALARHPGARPRLVVGFAAETEAILAHARAKLERKGCDWILANDVSPAAGTFGGDRNRVHLLRRDGGEEAWPAMDKTEVATRLAAAVAAQLGRASRDG